MGNASILLVEDHMDLAATIGEELESLGYAVDYAHDGAAGLGLATTQRYDAIVLDWMLPRLDGVEVCRRLREQRVATPVLMLTARDQLGDKVEGFDSGADDYLVKPFDMKELVVRLAALLRRSRGEVVEGELRVGDLVFDVGAATASRAGRRLSLSPTGLRILKVLMNASPDLVSREDLERALWGDLRPESDTLRSHIYNLRRELERPGQDKLLHTRPGIGYRLAVDDD